MTIINMVLLLIAIFGKKIESAKVIRIFKLNLYIGLAYWLAIIVSISVLKIAPDSLPFNPTLAEILVKAFTTVLFYRALKWAEATKDRKWLYYMIVLATMDLALVIISSF
jgi:hypothetical protein